MKTATFVKVCVWVLCLLGVIEGGFTLISASDTLLNLIGILLIVAFTFISYKTHFFINIKTTRKDGKENY